MKGIFQVWFPLFIFFLHLKNYGRQERITIRKHHKMHLIQKIRDFPVWWTAANIIIYFSMYFCS